MNFSKHYYNAIKQQKEIEDLGIISLDLYKYLSLEEMDDVISIIKLLRETEYSRIFKNCLEYKLRHSNPEFIKAIIDLLRIENNYKTMNLCYYYEELIEC